MEIKIVRKVMAANDAVADEVRALLRARGIVCYNLMGSPGSGKTTLLEHTVRAARAELAPGIVEGDIATTADAERLARLGVPVVQINTGPFGGECHLGANFVRAALDDLPLDELRTLFIENVGNLVCPAEFDVGESRRVAVLSVAEGEDKPLKYPLMFRVCHAVVVTKVDLLPHLDYDPARLRANLAAVNPALEVVEFSGKTGAGLGAWLAFLRKR
jgi:hydrogenase nickel incorporation protein HypB